MIGLVQPGSCQHGVCCRIIARDQRPTRFPQQPHRFAVPLCCTSLPNAKKTPLTTGAKVQVKNLGADVTADDMKVRRNVCGSNRRRAATHQRA